MADMDDEMTVEEFDRRLEHGVRVTDIVVNRPERSASLYTLDESHGGAASSAVPRLVQRSPGERVLATS
jgi:hypothetical protein